MKYIFWTFVFSFALMFEIMGIIEFFSILRYGMVVLPGLFLAVFVIAIGVYLATFENKKI